MRKEWNVYKECQFSVTAVLRGDNNPTVTESKRFSYYKNLRTVQILLLNLE